MDEHGYFQSFTFLRLYVLLIIIVVQKCHKAEKKPRKTSDWGGIFRVKRRKKKFPVFRPVMLIRIRIQSDPDSFGSVDPEVKKMQGNKVIVFFVENYIFKSGPKNVANL